MNYTTIMGITLRTVRKNNCWECCVTLAEVENGRYNNQRTVAEYANNYTLLKKCMLSKYNISLPNKAGLEFIGSIDDVDFYKIPGTERANLLLLRY